MAEGESMNEEAKSNSLSWRWLLLVIITGTVLAYAKYYWEVRDGIEAVTLKKGDIEFIRGGAMNQKDGDLALSVLLSFKGISDFTYLNVYIAIEVAGKTIHERRFESPLGHELYYVSSDTPKFPTIDEYIDQNAEVRLAIHQGDRLILEEQFLLQHGGVNSPEWNQANLPQLGTNVSFAHFRDLWANSNHSTSSPSAPESDAQP